MAVITTFVAGQNPTAATLSVLVNPPICELFQSVAQSVPHSGAVLTFDGEEVDTDGMHSTATLTSRATCQTAGRFFLAGGISFVSNATGRKGSWFLVNGVVVRGSETVLPSAAGNQTTTPSRSRQVYLNVGDYVELHAFQESGGALSTSTGFIQQLSTMSLRWIGIS